jgi:hypothetical protein
MKARPFAIITILAATCLTPAAGAAQTSAGRFEVGGHLSTLRIGDEGNTNGGIGGRVSYDLARWLAAEGELNFLPNDRLDVVFDVPSVSLTTRYSRRRVEGFFGPRIGMRGERVGVFAKVRPGFAHLTNRGMQCLGEDCARVLMLFVLPEYRTEFALDFGGVLEFYPSARAVARLDVGSTVIRHRSQTVPPCRDCTTRNLSTRLGIGVRF